MSLEAEMYSVVIAPRAATAARYRTATAVRVRFDVASFEAGDPDPLDFDGKVFLWQRRPDGVDRFVAVCQPLDLAAYPPDAPTEADGFFRRSWMEGLSDSVEQAGLKSLLDAQIRTLLGELEAMRTLASETPYALVPP